jgi:hypothetical protein
MNFQIPKVLNDLPLMRGSKNISHEAEPTLNELATVEILW